MRRTLAGLVGLALASGALALVPAHATTLPASTRAVTTTLHSGGHSESPIKHVVIIYQENHTFDDVLGAVCEARANPCNGYTGPVTFADGTTADNVVEPDIVPSVTHDPDSQELGLHNEWDLVNGCTTAPYYCVSHVDPTNIPNLATLADTFAVSDATFAAGHSATFGAHVTLGAGTFDGFAGYNPVLSQTGVKPHWGWGCPSRLDDLWGWDPDHLSYQPACVPDERGRGPYRASKVPYAPSIMERMEQTGLSWHIYEGLKPKHRPDATNFSVCSYFYWCYANRFKLKYDSSDRDFLKSAKDGKLPNLSILIPDGGVSQHNLTSMKLGDSYIGDMVGAVEKSPDWKSTAIFITYDDCGCFYDHVTPPSESLGLRNPLVIVSPWAMPQGTDSTTAVQPYSMLAFVEHTFRLHRLSKEVADAYDYEDAFDFSQRPIPGPPMTQSTVSSRESRQLARLLPLVEKDPA